MIRWLEKYFVPLATSIASTRWLVALRDAFISILPVTLAGSLSVLITSLINVAHDHLGWTTIYKSFSPMLTIDNVVWNGTFAIFALFFAASWGFHLARAYEVNTLSGCLISVASFIMSIANVANVKLKHPLPSSSISILADAKIVVSGKTVLIKDVFAIDQLSTTGLVTAMIFGALGVAIYIILVKAHFTIQIRDQIPQASRVAFAAILPAMVAIFSVAGVNYLFTRFTGYYFGDWLISVVQVPLLKAGQGFGMVIFVTFLVQAFWFFGLNGLNVLAPVLDSIWLTPQNLNIMAVKNGEQLNFNWVRGSFDAFAWFGGAGGTLMLVIAILIFSKKSEQRTLAKITLAPAIFNINEPVMFGLPVVLNTIYFIPFMIAPLVNVTLAYIVTQIGWVNPVQVAMPQVMPPILQAWLATNYDWRAIVLAIVNMIIALLIYLPFVLAANKVKENNEPKRYQW